jgi:hypothetical protein
MHEDSALHDVHDAANKVSFGEKGQDTISPIPKKK